MWNGSVARSRAWRLWVGWLACTSAVLLATASPHAAEPPKDKLELDLPLPELPKAPSSVLREPTREEVDRLTAFVQRLTSEESGVRENALSELPEVTPEWLPAVNRSLHQLADRGSHKDLKQLLTQVRSQAREAALREMKASRQRGQPKTPDYLQMLHQFARPTSDAWKATVTIVALSRMLVQVGSLPAARSLINVYARFGDFLRVDTQLQLDKLGDVAVAALIEAERHPSQKISDWAKRQLDLRHRALPSDAVSGADETALPEILRAYGRTKNPDAARIVVSFTNSERAQLRTAARQAIGLMGTTALWQLRDTYEDVVGRQAPRDWSWERMARELFREFDRLRLARVHQLFREGLAFRAAGDLPGMQQIFDQVLARNPHFEGSEQMAEGYLAFAEAAKPNQAETALLAAERAERLASAPELKKRATSMRLALTAHSLMKAGVRDATLLERALEINPENTWAQSLKQQFAGTDSGDASRKVRYVGAIAIALTAFAAISVILLRRPTPS